jgi:hypothetical protein
MDYRINQQISFFLLKLDKAFYSVEVQGNGDYDNQSAFIIYYRKCTKQWQNLHNYNFQTEASCVGLE